MSKNMWWGYRHVSGTVQAKRFFDDRASIQDACLSGFVAQIVQPFHADSRDEALKLVRQLTAPELILNMAFNQQLTRYDPKRVGRLVRHMRTVAGLSQGGLAERLNKDRSSISHIESGTHTVSLEDLMRSAQACGFEIRVSASRKVK